MVIFFSGFLTVYIKQIFVFSSRTVNEWKFILEKGVSLILEKKILVQNAVYKGLPKMRKDQTGCHGPSSA